MSIVKVKPRREWTKAEHRFEAMRKAVPIIAPRFFQFLHSPAWQGWRPKTIGELIDHINEKIDKVQGINANSEISSGGITVAVRGYGINRKVVVCFEWGAEAYYDKEDGGYTVV